jgi:5-(carboxyamino)imidazole ribonucleotide synthase
LRAHRVPTAPFFPVANFRQAREAWHEFAPSGGLVLKKRRFGYDGYGTFTVRTREELEALRLEVESNNDGFIAEKLIRFRREAAVMIARGRKGPAVVFPLVETKQEKARCLWVRGPLRLTDSARFIRRLTAFVESIRYTGILGVEIFDSKDGLLVNELAPRVHNSAHYSLDALNEDQFTAHLKAVLGLTLTKPKALTPGFAMLNLLGEDGVGQASAWDLPAELKLHWYGKSESRPGRKMGHLNATGTTANAALRKLLVARDQFRV